ncbi:MAG: hypothetical protein Q4A33_00090 [Candidatus Saccharibacteria bacterium]|nr:hypothetical protein [Candidatus Saccharibacteria bacterium]
MDKKELVLKIVGAVREEAAKIENSKNGAIRVLLYPMVKEADDWLGGFGAFARRYNPFAGSSIGENDTPDYELCYGITPGGRRVQEYIDKKTRKKLTRDTYALSALKIAYCSRVEDLEKGLSSSVELEDPNLSPENGYMNLPGAVLFIVRKGDPDATHPEIRKGYPWLYIYVCVCVTDEDEDRKCAMASLDVVKEFFPQGFNIEHEDK